MGIEVPSLGWMGGNSVGGNWQEERLTLSRGAISVHV